MEKISIAIDGPASSGKSTVAKILANKWQYVYCDTGAMYRALTYLAFEKNVSVEDESGLVQLMTKHVIHFKQMEDEQLVFIDETEVTQAIRQTNVTNAVSIVARHEKVREALVELQKKIGSNGGVVMDGRDIGTEVLPHAQVKVFLIASVTERAQRRYQENVEKGILTDYDTLKKEIEQRDFLDSTRKIAPLKQAEDAVKIDTTGLTIAEVVDKIDEMIKRVV